MTTRTASWIAAVVLGVTLPLHAIAAWLGATRPPLDGVVDSTGFDLLWLGSFVAFEVVGAVIVVKRPAHPIGWLFLAAGAVSVVMTVSHEYAVQALFVGIALPGGEVAAWLSAWTWPPGLSLIVVAVLLFPTGRPPSKRWWLVAWIAIGVPAIVAAANAIGLWGLRGPSLLLLNEESGADLWSLRLMAVAFPIYLASAVAAMIGLVVRYRRSLGVERQQLKVLALLAAVAAVALAAGETVATSGLPKQIADVMSAPGWFAVAAGVAILRYRLFDIDRVVSRTASYTALTALLACVYIASVVALGAVVRAATGGGSDLVIAASTLAVAALFQPLRRRVQALFDLRFNRTSYDAARLVEEFAHRLRDEVDLDVLASDVHDVAVRAIQPAHASVWLASTERRR